MSYNYFVFHRKGYYILSYKDKTEIHRSFSIMSIISYLDAHSISVDEVDVSIFILHSFWKAYTDYFAIRGGAQ